MMGEEKGSEVGKVREGMVGARRERAREETCVSEGEHGQRRRTDDY